MKRSVKSSPDVPSGLGYLAAVNQIQLQQEIKVLEIFSGFETAKKYRIKNSLGQDLYWAAEKSNCCGRNCCGRKRPFGIKIMDNHKNEVIHLYRPLACQSCCCPCCLQRMKVYAPPGDLIYTVKQKWHLCRPSFTIEKPNGETALRIKGSSCCSCRCICPNVRYKVLSADDKTVVGIITKQRSSGLAKEHFIDADNFDISFPMDIDVKLKAALLAACFLIDIMFYESSGKR